ncbi:hypothetical protein ACFS6H_13625 [Terrimonas rubra]|uniref:Dolichyl-phosphate-mannose-protein mannosyltransferase n=1 Tax=Terrimonas rubra TaxID=1035890 RepID=A0ABW6A5X2_9BACT
MLPKLTDSTLRSAMIGMVILFLGISLYTAFKNTELVYEWAGIVDHLIETGEYKYMGNYSAFMPPLYPWYLAGVHWLTARFTTGTTWLGIANFLQAVIFISAVYFTFRSFFYGKLSPRLLVFFGAVIFFPPVLLSVTKVSSFALSLSLALFFLALAYRLVVLKKKKVLGPFILVLTLAMYVRFEFGLYFLLLSCFLSFFSKQKHWNILIAAGLFGLIYAPWVLRNHVKMGMFTYSTSFQYNFSKGNNIRYDLFSTHNMPYDEQNDLRVEDEVVAGRFSSEKAKDDYLKKVNRYYLHHHPGHFFSQSVKKVGINFLQYFPDYHLFTKPLFAVLYSIFFTLLFLAVLAWSIRDIFFASKKHPNFLSVFTLVSFLFFLFFYSVAPLPRYALFFYPLFMVYILYMLNNKQQQFS